MNPQLNKPDLALLDLLTWRLRVATETQLLRLDETSVCRLPTLRRQRLICCQNLVACVPVMVEPIFAWSPGQAGPDCGALCWRLEHRRQRLAPQRVRVYWATALALKLMGSSGTGLRQPMQIEHDLGTSAVFLRHWQQDPDVAQKWLGEDLYRLSYRPKGKVPDAVLCDADGNVTKAIEVGSAAYSAARLGAFHRHCAKLLLPYELW